MRTLQSYSEYAKDQGADIKELIKVISLFDGIGGARQALKELNIDCEYYASEIDKFAIQIAKANHSNIIHIGDIKNIANLSINFDLLVGGSPCQDLSVAKINRQGLNGERSCLFYEYLRILKETKPKFFILENVASMSKDSRDIITKELFNIEPIMINSGLLTAQNRKRLYWVGRLINGQYEQVKIEQPIDKRILLKDIIEENVDEKHYINEKSLKTYTFNGKTTAYKEFGNDGCTAIRVGHFNKGGQGDRIYSIEGKSICLSANGGGRGAKTGLYAKAQKVRKLTTTECCRLQGFPDNYVSMVSNTQGYKALGNSFTVPIIKHILKQIYNL